MFVKNLKSEVFDLKEIKTEKKLKLWQIYAVAFWGYVIIEGLSLITSIVVKILQCGSFIVTLIIMNLLAIPAILTFINIFLIFIKPKDERKWKIKVRVFEIISVIIGFALSGILLMLFAQYADWYVQIDTNERHSPIWLESIPTFVLLCVIGTVGYFVLAFTHTKRTPPLVTVLAISAMYVGAFECVIWSIQVYKEEILLIVLPINCIIIAARLIREKALELKVEGDEVPYKKSGFVGWINHELGSGRFPIWALVLAFPLLGAAIGILVLFGQRPDYIIKGYTETADWTLSQHIAPSGYDSHYLCTVAAQGHKKLVKPQRIGIRHGRRTIVNRQLCIANAFEQILEERTPKLHKTVRSFYDTHGFPLSKLIKTKAAADFVYIVMKPLEWLFLIALYLFTSNPEERISRQYIR